MLADRHCLQDAELDPAEESQPDETGPDGDEAWEEIVNTTQRMPGTQGDWYVQATQTES